MGYLETYRGLAACYARMGLLTEARDTIVRLRPMTPVVVPRPIPFRDFAHPSFTSRACSCRLVMRREWDPPVCRHLVAAAPSLKFVVSFVGISGGFLNLTAITDQRRLPGYSPTRTISRCGS